MNYSNPTANIAVNNNVIKVYNGCKVYLENDQEFQIELFNPTTGTIAAEIFLNDQKAFQSLLVLRPGERTFLDCNPDTKRKFKFETYSVDGKDESVKKAIRSNGKIEVKFYRENTPPPRITYTPYPFDTKAWPFNDCFVGTCGSGGTTSRGIGGQSFCTDESSSNYCCSSNVNKVIDTSNQLELNLDGMELEQKTETGRIEAGEHSGQDFVNVSKTFDGWAFSTASFQLVPVSQRPIVAQDIRAYCTNCGSRKKKASWRFCPDCSEQY